MQVDRTCAGAHATRQPTILTVVVASRIFAGALCSHNYQHVLLTWTTKTVNKIMLMRLCLLAKKFN